MASKQTYDGISLPAGVEVTAFPSGTPCHAVVTFADAGSLIRSPTQGPSSATSQSDKAKKWAAFKAQNYDGEGWGDDYSDGGASPPRPAAPIHHETAPSTASPEVASFASNLPPSVVSSLASAQNGSRDSLPSQVTGTRTPTDLTRGIVVSGGTATGKRGEGRDSPNRRSLADPRSSSPQPAQAQGPPQPQDLQESRIASDAPASTIPEAEETARSPSEKRFSRSPQLPDLGRMSMFGDDLFKSSFNEEPPPPMPALPSPSGLGIQGAGAQQSDVTAGATHQTPPQIAPASPSAPPAERPASPTSSGDTAAQDNSAAPQSDAAASSNILQQSSVSPLVSEGTKTPDSQQAASTLNPSGMVGQTTAPAESTDNVSSLNESLTDRLPREFSPSPLRSMSPAAPMTSPGDMMAQKDTPGGIASPVDATSPTTDNTPDPAQPALQPITTNATSSSSAPRESDLLREEIIKSLGRAASTGQPEDDAPTDKRQSTLDSGIRESTYLPAVYDDYWATTAEDRNDAPEVPSLPSGTSEEAAIAPLRPGSKSPAATPSAHALRKQFSWEQSSEAAAPPAPSQPESSDGQAEPPTGATGSPVAGPSSTELDGQGDAKVEAPEEHSNTDHDDGGADVTRNESQLSKATAVEPDTAPKRLSLAAEKEIMELSTDDLSAGLAGDHPALRDSASDAAEDTPKASPKLAPKQDPVKPLTFREIMGLGTVKERTAKFDETRLQYASMDQGLDGWIITLKAQPEHANASAVFNASVLNAPTNAALGAKAQTTATGQPYYQQYLNASSAPAGIPGRSASTGLGGSSPASAFKHGSNQAGVKSKELLLAAGKAGKGLLSKGKYKLRGSTSDKVFL